MNTLQTNIAEKEKEQVYGKPFIHLHCHSHYSLLDGLSKIPDLIKKAKEYGMNALAITDHGAMYGAIEFYKACLKNDIKPIIGVEAYMAQRSRFDKDNSLDKKRYHLTLLAKNEKGYKNLLKLVSKANIEGFYYKPRMDEELLKEHSEGVICLSGCPGSRFIQALKNADEDEARRVLAFYIEAFGKENVFVEIMIHPEVEWYMPLLEKIRSFAKEFDLPLVATWDSHYIAPDDKEAHDTLMAINTNNKTFKLHGDYSFISPEQAYELFGEYGFETAVENTQKVADMVNIEFDPDSWEFPAFPIEEDEDHDVLLREQAYAGLAPRKIELTEEVRERIEYELGIIKAKKYATYFLSVADFISYGRTVGILTNTRGSAAGSLVSYLCFISNVDPLKFNLIFERFLNPERPSLPDIDLDIADDRRDDLIDYAREKYGKEAVAQIGTFGTMAARGVVRDVARALEYPYAVGDRLAKLIPMGAQGFAMTIDRALEEEPEFKAAYENETNVREIVDLAKKIEGCARHISVHAAGVVISSTGDVTDFAPIQVDPKAGKLITQYNMYTGFKNENVVGMPKFDFLGLRNLSILADSLVRVKKIRGTDIDIDHVSNKDLRTFKLFTEGRTLGVFQFASDGMQRWLRELKPTVIDDVIAMVALYRPGPMDFIPLFIERKQNPSLITYTDPRLEKILSRTYGIIVYQEDVMIIATTLAGYSWLEADKLRKAMGKKIPALMAEQEEKFINGCIELKMDAKVARDLWDQIETFAAYGFNKCHATAYGQLSYRTAYMKANYPAEYLTAIMSAESGNPEKVALVVAECINMGFDTRSPSVNESFSNFTVVVEDAPPADYDKEKPFHPEGDFTPDGRFITKKIRFGLRNIKNFGEEIGKAILHERKENGLYTSLENFLERVQHRNLTKKSMEALIMSGAFDEFAKRDYLLGNLETMLEFNRDITPANDSQGDLFASLDVKPKSKLFMSDEAPKMLRNKVLAWEKELLGIFLTGNPLTEYIELFKKRGCQTSTYIRQFKSEGNPATLGGMIEDIREINTKKGDRMAFVRMRDLFGTMEVVFFPETYQRNKFNLKIDAILQIKGKVSERNDTHSILADSIERIDKPVQDDRI